MARKVRFLYRWGEDSALDRVGSVTEARLRAWEYDIASEDRWITDEEGVTDTVRLWRTRRPDLAAPELWVGEVEVTVDA
jgi:hypothetical protein